MTYGGNNFINFHENELSDFRGGVRISEGESPGYMPRIITAPCCRLSFFVATAVEDMSIDMPNCELFVLPTLSCVYDDGSWFCVETT